jgi:hypothetical protein
MMNPTWTGVLHDGSESVSALPEPVTAARRAVKRVWGVVCGASFLAARGSLYLLVLPFTVLVSLAGIALYAFHAGAGGDHG